MLYCDPDGAAARAARTGPPPRPQDAGSELSARRQVPSRAADRCEVADSNLQRAEAALRAARLPEAAPRPLAPWDGRTPPLYGDRVAQRLGLSAAEQALLLRNRFVVLDRAPFLRAGSFARLFHEIYQAELPLYVSADAVLAAVFASSEGLLQTVESERLRPLLGQVLRALHCALPAAAADYPREVAADLDLYLATALSLLDDKPAPSHFGADAEVAALLERGRRADAMAEVTLFGRPRIVDFTQFQPRGHYALPAEGAAEGAAGAAASPLAGYFRAVMWLSRLELNLVSRSCRSSQPGLQLDPSETPREAADALALADLAERSGALPELGRIERAFRTLAGPREDVGIEALLRLRREAGIGRISIPESAAALRARIGSGFRRTARQHYMPEGATELPVIATLLGAAVVADAAATRPLVHSELPGRHRLRAVDLGFVLGHDRATAYLADDLKAYPTLPAQLVAARQGLSRALAAAVEAPDLYSAWLGGVRGLAASPAGTVPSFMAGEAFRDLRLNSALAGFGQLRHSYVLMAAQSYSEGGCEIPDGYVDPAVAVYEAVARYAERGAAALRELDPEDKSAAQPYFRRLREVMQILAGLARHELSNQPLPQAGRDFLSMVAEMTPETSGSPPTYTGWYFDLFRRRQDEALVDADFLTDFFTAGDGSGVAYVGAQAPALGVFVVDTGGPPRLVVGPVARAYQLSAPQSPRLSALPAPQAPGAPGPLRIERPWAQAYTAPAPQVPELRLEGHICDGSDGGGEGLAPRGVFVLRSQQALGPVRIDLLDHHYAPVATQSRAVAAGEARFVLVPRRGWSGVQGVALRVGDFSWRWQRQAMSCAVSLELAPAAAGPRAAE